MRASMCLALASCALLGCGDGSADPDAGPSSMDAQASADAQLDADDAGPPADAGLAECAPDAVGRSCALEGEACGPPCEACASCERVRCMDGVWRRVETAPRCFACGESDRCVTGEQHCERSVSDVAGVADSYACRDNPDACVGRAATCACLAEDLVFDECVAIRPGELEIRHYGG